MINISYNFIVTIYFSLAQVVMVSMLPFQKSTLKLTLILLLCSDDTLYINKCSLGLLFMSHVIAPVTHGFVFCVVL